MNKKDYQRAKDIMAGKIKRLYIAGHNHKLGHAVALEYTDAKPVRYYQCDLPKIRAIVDRFNRIFGIMRK